MPKHIMTFEVLKIKTLQILEITEQPMEIIKRVKSINTERRLKNYIKTKLSHIHHWFIKNNIDFDASIEIMSKPKVSHLKLLKIHLIKLLRERKVNDKHFIQINNLKNRNFLASNILNLK